MQTLITKCRMNMARECITDVDVVGGVVAELKMA